MLLAGSALRAVIDGEANVKRVPTGDAVRRKYPEAVVFVVSADGEGNTNVMPAGWNMFTSGDPTMLAVSVGLTRHTHANLMDAEEYVVGFPSAAQKDDVIYCGSHSGADVDKFDETDLETAPADEVSVPIIRDAAACFECRKHDTLVTGDHRIFAGEILAAHVSEIHEERIVQIGKEWDGVDRFRTLSELLDGRVSRPVESD